MRSSPRETLAGNAITKRFTFAGFPEAVAFVGRLVPGAESADHHPDIAINYKRVTLTYSTHSEGGLTLKDFWARPWLIASRRQSEPANDPVTWSIENGGARFRSDGVPHPVPAR